MLPLAATKIVLAVTGGIAAYKAADVTSQLVQLGADIEVILSAGGRQFVQPLTFAALTRRPVHTDPFEPWTADFAGHISLAREARLLLVVPASANAIARLALGLADDLLGAVALSTRAPLLIAPAMEHGMYHHPATQGHLETLRRRGALIVGPESGRLASSAFGDGRLAPPDTIVGAVRFVLGRDGPLSGRRLVVTAGGTHEPIDPVRFIGNRSSGLMGLALAQAAIDRGGTVSLIVGPTHLPTPFGAEVRRVQTAEEMFDAVSGAVRDADALVMAAAVADFRPAIAAAQKIKKRSNEQGLSIDLVRNPDILATVGGDGLVKVGFAAETAELIANAQAKLASKGLAMIVANKAETTIGSADSQAVIIVPGATPTVLPAMPKTALAVRIIDRLISLLSDRSSPPTPP